MRELFSDTLAGQVIRFASRGHILARQDNSISLLVEKTKAASTSDSNHQSNGSMVEKAEGGNDPELITWNGPDDPAVSASMPMLSSLLTL